jgi:hypothetical protein
MSNECQCYKIPINDFYDRTVGGRREQGAKEQ